MEGVGLIRALKFAKYLPEYGWQPVVLTIKNDSNLDRKEQEYLANMTVYRTEYRDLKDEFKKLLYKGPANDTRQYDVLKKLLFIPLRLAMGPDDQIGWRGFAVDAGLKAIDEEKVDLIFSTSPPETTHLIAQELKKRRNLPWVADLRDLWAEDHYRKRPFVKKLMLKSMEKRVLFDTDLLLTVSKPWADKLSGSMGNDKKAAVIENGFDEEDFKGIPFRKNEKFTITYTGKLNKDNQPIEGFFKALKGLIEAGGIDREKIEVKFYLLGHERPGIDGIARAYGLEGVVRPFEGVGYERSLEIQRASDILLFVQWQGPGSDGWYSAKLYDYIGARRPILAMAKKGGIVEALIDATGSGLVVEDETGLKEAILKFYDEHERKGDVGYGGDEARIAGHTRRLRAKELAGLFDELF